MSAGTLTLTNNSDIVTGIGTSFATELDAGDFVVVTVGGVPYTLPVKSVESDTDLTLVSNFTGPTQSGAAWSAVPRVALNMVTAALVAQSAEALRGLNYDKQNWQQVFSAAGNITVKLPDGTTFTGPSWKYLSDNMATKSGGAVPVNQGGTGSTSASGARTNLGLGDSVTANFGSLEIGAKKASSASFIDFHFLGTNDYDARILCGGNSNGAMGKGDLTFYAGKYVFIGDGFEFRNPITCQNSISASAKIATTADMECKTKIAVLAPADNQNAHVWFYGTGGASRGVIYSGQTGIIQIRPDNNDNGGSNGYSFAFGADGKFTCVTMNQTSDERVKFDKEPVSNALEKICSLTGYTFGIQLTESESVHSAGIIAQDLEKVLPVAVSAGANGITPTGEEINDLKTVDYSAMSALYVEAIKELYDRVRSMENELANLQVRSGG